MQAKMTPLERRAVASLSGIMSLRLIGLFMIIPVFSLYVSQFKNATPLLLGLSMGIYGLTQAILQIPFGMLSDRLGRKPIILLGLLIFIAGSLLAACTHSIYGMIVGRALQGAGAIGSTVTAFIADFTRETQRTKAMAINGMMIGLSFSLAMMLGPLFAAWMNISGIFWLAAAFGGMAILLLFYATPTAPDHTWHPDAEVATTQFWSLLKDPRLAPLYISVFLLHTIFTASFVVIPLSLQHLPKLYGHGQWKLFLPALLLGFVLSILCMMRAEKKQQVKAYFVAGIIGLGLAEGLLSRPMDSVLTVTLLLTLFFAAFSLLEAFLPSWISRLAPTHKKGTVLGIFSSAQFLGIFVGGSTGGALYGATGLQNVYLFCMGLTLLWIAIACRMQGPQSVSSRNTSQAQH